MKHLIAITSVICFLSVKASAQSDSAILYQLRTEVLMHGKCYDNLRVLTKMIGHRISGSPEAARAVEWGKTAMHYAGADSVWLQPVMVPHWVRGKEYLNLQMIAGKGFEPVKMLSLGNSEASGKELQAEVIMVNTFEEFNKLPANKVKGKIVFFNYRFRQDLVNTFAGYGDAVRYRGATPALVAGKGGIAVIIRSVSTGADDFPHTGMTRYVDSLAKIPAVAIGNITADALEKAVAKGNVKAQVFTSGKMMDEVLSYNVIGEIRGTELPNEYVIAGGHLDSWDVGEGANDDGAGCVQAIEMIRVFKAMGIRPKRTVRAVLFMNEENGARGGRAYADSAKAHHEKHILAMESDAGGFSPRGIGMEMPAEKKIAITKFAPLFLPLNVYDFTMEEGGTDVDPLKALGTPTAGLIPDPQRYFDIHHTNNDIFENVNHRELKLGAATMASLVYLISKYGMDR